MALSSKLQEKSLLILDRIELEEIKTKKFLEITNAIGTSGALFVTDLPDENLELSSRNLSDFKVVRTEGLNVYDILKYPKLVLLEASLKGIERRLAT